MSLFDWRDIKPSQMTDAWYAAQQHSDTVTTGQAMSRVGLINKNPIAENPCARVCTNSKRISMELIMDSMEFRKDRDYTGRVTPRRKP